jgi:hypothetical protein
MNTETDKKITGGKLTLIILAGFLICFLVYYAFMSMAAPSRKLNEIKAAYSIKQEKGDPADERILYDSAYISMIKEKAFLQSKIAMAGNDSIYMILNLADSTANLEISGVEVHSAKITEMKTSSILRRGNEHIIYSMLSVPLNIVSDYSTFRKEPLMIKMAPKDTSEYKPDIIPDTTDYEPVNYILEMDNGIRIFVSQDENISAYDKKHYFLFDLNDRMRNTWSSLRSVAKFKVPYYHPFIKIKLPKADAKILYRAIPRKGQIAVYM